jgi:3-hydroxybutyryl-CoA dehydrogenase
MMNILIVGNEMNLNECRQKFGDTFKYTLLPDQQSAAKSSLKGDLIFDFLLDKDPSQIKQYTSNENITLLINTSKISLLALGSLVNQNIGCTVFGFCGLPTFLNRDLLEVSLYNEPDKAKLEQICTRLKTKFSVVDDRVGMVTPRIICMIINEAYYTVQEGTATREDIDLAMKLGTNYPYGPFEWAQRIGIKNVYELLEAVYTDTKDERYKICPLLKKEYLLNRN